MTLRDLGPDAGTTGPSSPSSAPSSAPSDPSSETGTEQVEPRPRSLGVLAAGVLAAVLGIASTFQLWLDPSGRVVSGNIPDATHYSWWLAHTPFAILHGQDPFTTTAMNWPTGVGTMNNTTLVLPSIVLYPITWLFGSLATLNVLNSLAVPACIAAAYWALRQADVVYDRSGGQLGRAVALAGATVFAISPAIVNSLVGHVTMAFAPGLPILLVLGVRAWLSPRPGRAGLWLGLAATAQVFIGEEVLFQAGLGSLIILVTAALSRPRLILVAAARLARSMALALGILLVLAGYGLHQQFFGPLRQHGSPFLPDYYGADLTAFYTTSDRLQLHTPAGTLASASFPGGVEEHLAYLGVPLLMLCLLVAVTGWRRLPVRCASAGLLLSMLLSLGGRIWVGGVQGTLHGPYALLQSFPVTEASLATRLALLAAVFAGALLGLGLQRLLVPGAGAGGSAGSGSAGGGPAGSGSVSSGSAGGGVVHEVDPVVLRMRGVVAGLVALLCLAPLVPKQLATEPAAQVPSYFSTTARSLAGDPVLLVLPYPNAIDPVAMRWQVAANFSFRMPGGYFLGPGPDRKAFVDGDADPYLGALLKQVSTTGQVAPASPELKAQAIKDLSAWGVDAIVLGLASTPGGFTARSPAGVDALRTTLTGLLGPPQESGGVLIWNTPLATLS